MGERDPTPSIGQRPADNASPSQVSILARFWLFARPAPPRRTQGYGGFREERPPVIIHDRRRADSAVLGSFARPHYFPLVFVRRRQQRFRRGTEDLLGSEVNQEQTRVS